MIGKTLQDRYRIEEELGRGGMGVIYACEDTLLNRKVAIKMLVEPGWGTQGKARWLAEARAAARLNHPNIVTIHDAGLVDDTPFIVMELVEGRSLCEVERLSLEEILQIASQVAAALAHAHANQVIHRDLKPENIVLTPNGIVKLMDFGLARSLGTPQQSQAGAVVGTFTYIAPELISGAEASPQSDLYALGIMLYELLTGQAPFESNDLMQLLAQHLHAAVKPPSSLRPDLPEEVDDLVMRLLSKQPHERPASASDVQQEIQCILENTPVESHVPAPGITNQSPHNLPFQRTRFIGRQKEITQTLKRIIENPLVTLTGSGGVGKTRLALQVARQALSYFPDGAWLVELAALADPALVPQAAASALDVHNEPGKSTLDSLTGYLQSKELVLILDNCEHLIGAVAELAEHLVAHCEHVHILASSREPLGIDGEAIVNVPSLSLPAAGESDPDAVAHTEAAQLFANRAAAFVPGFQVDEANALQVAQICIRLDGIPLALELAASRVKVLSVEQIAARLDDTFRLLSGGSRTALPRQQTLRAAIDWSYNLLSPGEQELLRRLSVFAGGFWLAGAEAVCSGQPTPGGLELEEDEILDLLTRLTDKSLVMVERKTQAERRFRLLETIRQYGREKLHEAGETRFFRQKHSRDYCQFAIRAAAELHGPDQIQWLERLDTEIDNLRAALTWLSEEGASQELLEMAAALSEFWDMHGYLSEGQGWLEKALAEAQGAPLSAAHVQALYGLSGLLGRTGEMDAIEMLEKGYQLSLQLGDEPVIAQGLTMQGIYAHYLGKPAQQVEDYCNSAIERWREIGDRRGEAQALGPLAGLAARGGDYEQAIRIYQQSLELFRQVGDVREIAGALWNLAEVALSQGSLAQAQEWANESQALYKRLNDRHGIATALRTAAAALHLQGNDLKAQEYYEESIQLLTQLADQACLAMTCVGLGQVALRLGDLSRAKRLGEDGLAKLGLEVQEKIPALLLLGQIALAEGEALKAQDFFEQALETSQQAGIQTHIPQALEWMACARVAAAGQAQPLAVGEAAISPGRGADEERTAAELSQAVQFFGAAQAMRETHGVPAQFVEEIEVEVYRAKARDMLGEAAFEEAWEEGKRR